MMRTLKDKYCTFNVLLNVCWWIFSLIRPLKNSIVHKLFAELHERYQKAKPFIIIAFSTFSENFRESNQSGIQSLLKLLM